MYLGLEEDRQSTRIKDLLKVCGNSLTLGEMILVSAANLNKDEFSLSALIVECWGLFVGTFSLQDYIQYPDSNKVSSTLSSKRGPIARGWISKPCPKTYTVTKVGETVIDLLAKKVERKSKVHMVNGKKPKKVIYNSTMSKWTSSAAYIKFYSGDKLSINILDACKFWLVDNSAPTRKDTKAVFDKIRLLLSQVGDLSEVATDTGPLREVDIRRVKHVHDYLMTRFFRYINGR